MPKTIYWAVTPLQMPAILHHCAKCGGQNVFICSGNFRINAQQRHLDVWLIYRCEKCRTTLNAAVFTRVAPKGLEENLYRRLAANDPALAFQYACDPAFLSKNRLQPSPDGFACEVTGEAIPAGEPVELHIRCPYPTGIRLDKLLSEKTGLSRERVKTLFRSGAIACEGVKDAAKCRLSADILLHIQLDMP